MMKPIGVVSSLFTYKNGTPRQPSVCDTARGSITISKDVFNTPEHSLDGIEQFSHLWIIFEFHKNNNQYTKAKVKPPRLDGRRVGLFSTRSPYRPNPIGLTLAKLDRVEGAKLYVSGIDILDGSPVLDIKPYIPSYDCPASPTKTPGDPDQKVATRTTTPGDRDQNVATPTKTPGDSDQKVSTLTKTPGYPDQRLATPIKTPDDSDQRETTFTKTPGDPDQRETTPTNTQGDPDQKVSTPTKTSGHPDQRLATPSKISGDPDHVLSKPLKSFCDTDGEHNQHLDTHHRTENLLTGTPQQVDVDARCTFTKQNQDASIANVGSCSSCNIHLIDDQIKCDQSYVQDQLTDQPCGSRQTPDPTFPVGDHKHSSSCDSAPNGDSCVSVNCVRTADWVSTPPIDKLTVRFTQTAELQLANFNKSSADLDRRLQFLNSCAEAKTAILEILREDPRSVYRRRDCSDRLYFFVIDTIHVTCWFDDSLVEVVRIIPVSQAKHLRASR